MTNFKVGDRVLVPGEIVSISPGDGRNIKELAYVELDGSSLKPAIYTYRLTKEENELSFPDQPVEPKEDAKFELHAGSVAKPTYSHGPVAMPNADNITHPLDKARENFKKAGNDMCDAEFYALACKLWHRRPNITELGLFKVFNVDWFSTTYNAQGFLEVDLIVFEDGSDWSKNSGIDRTLMES